MTWIFSIEGNIGSGKSTAIKHLAKKLHYINGKKIVYILEPVDIWNTVKDENDNNIIERFYNNPKKFAFQFQMMAYITRITKIRNTIRNNPNCIIITERSIYSDRAVFAKMLYDSKLMDSCEYQIYNKWFDEYMFRLVIHKRFIDDGVLDILNQKPIKLPPWDPMFAPEM